MRYQLIIRPEAEAELTEAFDWYERRVAGLGGDLLAELAQRGREELLVLDDAGLVFGVLVVSELEAALRSDRTGA